jgi:membrane protein
MHQRAGWVWRFSGAVWTRMTDSHFGLIAAGVAFYAMFAVFPGLTATIAIWSLLSDPAVIADYLRIAEGFLPDDAAALVHDQVMALLAAPRGALGWATLLSVGVAIYAARAGVAALIQGMDVVHQARPRALLWGWVVDLTMTAALIVALMAAMATIVIVPLLLSLVPLGAAEGWLLAALPWMAMFLLVLGCLGLLYRYGPNVPGRPPPPSAPAAQVSMPPTCASTRSSASSDWRRTLASKLVPPVVYPPRAGPRKGQRFFGRGCWGTGRCPSPTGNRCGSCRWTRKSQGSRAKRELVFERMAGKDRVALFDIHLHLVLQPEILEEAVNRRHIVIILVLGRFLRLRLDQDRALEADLVLVFDHHVAGQRPAWRRSRPMSVFRSVSYPSRPPHRT